MVRTCIPDRTMQCKSRHIKVEWMHLRVQCNTLHSGLQQQWWYWEGFLQALVSHSSHSPFTWPAPAALQQLTLPTQTQMPIQIQTQMPIKRKHKFQSKYNRKHKCQYKYNRTHILHFTRENTTHVGAHPLPLDVLIIFDILVELDKYGNKSKFDETSRLV